MSKKTFDELAEKYTPEELADSIVFPVELTAKQRDKAAAQLAKVRKEARTKVTAGEEVALKLMRLKITLEDYLQSDKYNPKLTFGYFLTAYLDLINKKRNEFADEIGIHETLLSQLVNDRREPNDSMMIRLELHSGNAIPALHWLKLVEKSKENYISTDQDLRRRERKFVKKHVALS